MRVLVLVGAGQPPSKRRGIGTSCRWTTAAGAAAVAVALTAPVRPASAQDVFASSSRCHQEYRATVERVNAEHIERARGCRGNSGCIARANEWKAAQLKAANRTLYLCQRAPGDEAPAPSRPEPTVPEDPMPVPDVPGAPPDAPPVGPPAEGPTPTRPTPTVPEFPMPVPNIPGPQPETPPPDNGPPPEQPPSRPPEQPAPSPGTPPGGATPPTSPRRPPLVGGTDATDWRAWCEDWDRKVWAIFDRHARGLRAQGVTAPIVCRYFFRVWADGRIQYPSYRGSQVCIDIHNELIGIRPLSFPDSTRPSIDRHPVFEINTGRSYRRASECPEAR